MVLASSRSTPPAPAPLGLAVLGRRGDRGPGARKACGRHLGGALDCEDDEVEDE